MREGVQAHNVLLGSSSTGGSGVSRCLPLSPGLGVLGAAGDWAPGSEQRAAWHMWAAGSAPQQGDLQALWMRS